VKENSESFEEDSHDLETEINDLIGETRYNF
jgi:hypothetical protein